MNVEPATDLININDRELLSKIVKDIKIRKLSREAIALAKNYGYLPYMVQRYIDMLGYEDTVKLLNTFENYAFRPTILCNYLKINCRLLVERLTRLGFELEQVGWCNYSYITSKSAFKPSLGSTHEYLKGFYYVYRDAASLLPVLALSPTKGAQVLDLCAAPGGKSVHILLAMRDHGLLIANDISKKRLRSLTTNLFRMGFKSFIITAEDGVILPRKVNIKFDYVLLDAPCSAEGAIMFDKSRKTKTSEEDLARLVLREIKLLLSAISMAKSGARIVYTTCSIAPEENEYVITKVIEFTKEKTVDVDTPSLEIGDRGLRRFRDLEFYDKVSQCIRIWPHRHLMEGYFICVLRRL